MRLRTVRLNQYGKSLLKQLTDKDTCVAAWSQRLDAWVPLLPALHFTRTVINDALTKSSVDMIEFLKNYDAIKSQIVELLEGDRIATFAQELKACFSDEEHLIPLSPLSLRDASLYKKHTEAATMAMAKRFMGPLAFLILSLWDNLLSKPFGITMPLAKNKVAEKRPIYYNGNHLAMYPHGHEIVMPSYSSYLDYEMEVAAILGKTGRNLTAEEAHKLIVGYVLFNDFSVRNQQVEDCVTSRFGMQKSKSFANSMASILVTADEIEQLGGYESLRGEVLLNNQLTAVGSTKDPLFSPAELIAYLSMNETLVPGEMIGLGTLPRCAGIEIGKQLRTGDTISFQMQPFGVLSNKIGSNENVDTNRWMSAARKHRLGGSAVKRFGAFVAFLLPLILLVGYWFSLPSPIDPIAVELPAAVPVEKMHVPVHYITDDQIDIYDKDFYAPESFASDDAHAVMYVSTRDGCIRRVNVTAGINECIYRTGNINETVRASLPPLSECNSEYTQKQCGVPLGVKLDKHNDRLLVVDAYYGLFELRDFRSKSPKAKKLADSTHVGGLTFFNSLDVTGDGTIYFTCSDYRPLNMYPYIVLEARGNGAVFKYGTDGKVTRVASEISFANGIRVARDESYLLVSETSAFRILRVYLKGARAGQKEIFAETPCAPDNLLVDLKKNELTYGCTAPLSPFFRYVFGKPMLKKMLSKLPYFLEIFAYLRPKFFKVSILDFETGQPKRVFVLANSRNPLLHSVSEAHFETKENSVYIGSFANRFLGRIRLPTGQFEMPTTE